MSRAAVTLCALALLGCADTSPVEPTEPPKKPRRPAVCFGTAPGCVSVTVERAS